MAKISKGLAQKLDQLIQGEVLPASQLKFSVITQMLDNGILEMRIQGRSRRNIYAPTPGALENYLSSVFGINDIKSYICNLEEGKSRADNILASSDSKSTKVRTFKGFLVNCTLSVRTQLNGEECIIKPKEGAFTYIYDFETFEIPASTLVVGVENAENFRFIAKQSKLFSSQSILFVSRYPQSNDLISWLKNIPNHYLHYGDFDFEGIRIYRDEYLKHLGNRADFYIPENIEALLNKYGNKELYNKQYRSVLDRSLKVSPAIEEVIMLFHKYKKCLEQEVLIV